MTNMGRAKSYIIITLVYIIATFAGLVCYFLSPFDPWLSLLVSDAFATVVTFGFSLLFRNASVYDPYWSVQPIVILIAFFVGCEFSMAGLLLVIAVLLWGIRLTANWAYTFHGMEHQDWRYTMLKETTGGFYPIINFVGIHMVPTLVVYFCTLPAVFVIYEGAEVTPISILFLMLSISAVLLQGTSDVQMQSYRKNRTTPFIRVGLWKYSRHPNYLGEILMWWSVALYSVAVLGFRWYLILGALLNTLLFLFVSIPMADKRQSAKPGFEEYKKETRMLLPIKK